MAKLWLIIFFSFCPTLISCQTLEESYPFVSLLSPEYKNTRNEYCDFVEAPFDDGEFNMCDFHIMEYFKRLQNPLSAFTLDSESFWAFKSNFSVFLQM
jgi:hypothetical protein